MAVKSYRELVAWQKAMDFIQAVYLASAEFPRDEIYGLTSQLRRSVVSIASNIAEGQGRRSTREFLNFLSIAYGSICEAQTQILIAERLRFFKDFSSAALLTRSAEVARLVNGLANSLENK